MAAAASALASRGVRARAMRARSAASVDLCAWNACSACLYDTPRRTTGAASLS
jgi:hypothetical protein